MRHLTYYKGDVTQKIQGNRNSIRSIPEFNVKCCLNNYICKVQAFSDFKFNKQILSAVEEADYTNPTEIQTKAIPSILSGRDVVGIAQTGTGKTAAFVLPLLMILKYAQGEDARALILCPTRELAIQLGEHIEMFSTYLDLRKVVLYGGIGPKRQIEALEKGVDIIVSTPNRFMDLYKKGHIHIRSLRHLVLDEADKIMDMGFVGMIHNILEVIPQKKQILLFSATMGERVQRIADDFLKSPVHIEVSLQATPAHTVKQELYKVPNFQTKINLLKYLFTDNDVFYRIIIFCRMRRSADLVYEYLTKRYGEKHVRVIHANKGQNTRINSIEAFKEGNLRILVATDVAARGLDVSEVSHVVNFDIPIVIEDYVHRIGRTGRAEREGTAITFCNPAEEYHLKRIEALIRQKIPQKTLPKEVFVEKTPYREQQEIAREVDKQKRREDPNYRGAFHEKKDRNEGVKKRQKDRKKRRGR